MKNYIDQELLNIELLQYIKKIGIKISTMSATCKLNVDIDLKNVYEHFELKMNEIITKKHAGQIQSLRKIKKKRKEVKKHFHNQLTLEIIPDEILFPENKISVKIFKNGSIQMSGIKSLGACNYSLNKLISNLEMELNEEIKFIKEDQKINLNKFKIDMINSNFNIGFQINRKELHILLLKMKIICRYEPCIHACVNIKFKSVNIEKQISIFVFQSGSIIITGAKNIESIVESYNFITEILETYKHDIEKIDFSYFKDKKNLIDKYLSNYNYKNDCNICFEQCNYISDCKHKFCNNCLDIIVNVNNMVCLKCQKKIINYKEI